MKNLFVIILRYVVSIDQIDAARPGHLEFLKEYYKKGNFIISGRQNPVIGGIIMARGKDRNEIWEIIKLDPFYTQNLAEFNIYEFTPNMCADDAEFLKQFV